LHEIVKLIDTLLDNTIQYNAAFYSAVSRKRIGGAWRQCLDRLCGSVCRRKELRL